MELNMTRPVDLTNPIFTDIEAARAHFEAIRWPNGPYCPFCGVMGDRVAALGGKSMGPGWYHCKDCRKKFTAAVGSLYERSHIPLCKWLLATQLMCSSKKGMSAHQLWRMLGFGSYRTAWFMAHRIREGMREARIPGQFGGDGEVVEADETYVGGKKANKHKSKRTDARGAVGKEPVLTLVERGGRAASHHVPDVTAATVRQIVLKNVTRASRLHTDESRIYSSFAGHYFAAHEGVMHSAEEDVRVFREGHLCSPPPRT